MSHRQTTTPPPRPTTPLRASSRTSLRSSTSQQAPFSHHNHPLDTLEPQFAELSDSLADLESNLMHLQLMHESLSRFSENFAAFLYGMEMNAFVVDWPEQPLVESYARWKARQRAGGDGDTTMMQKTPTKSAMGMGAGNDVDSTLLSDTTFASLKATPRRRTMGATGGEEGKSATTTVRGGRGGRGAAPQRQSSIPARSGSSAGRGARGGTGTRGSTLPTRGRGRGVR